MRSDQAADRGLARLAACGVGGTDGPSAWASSAACAAERGVPGPRARVAARAQPLAAAAVDAGAQAQRPARALAREAAGEARAVADRARPCSGREALAARERAVAAARASSGVRLTNSSRGPRRHFGGDRPARGDLARVRARAQDRPAPAAGRRSRSCWCRRRARASAAARRPPAGGAGEPRLERARRLRPRSARRRPETRRTPAIRSVPLAALPETVPLIVHSNASRPRATFLIDAPVALNDVPSKATTLRPDDVERVLAAQQRGVEAHGDLAAARLQRDADASAS